MDLKVDRRVLLCKNGTKVDMGRTQYVIHGSKLWGGACLNSQACHTRERIVTEVTSRTPENTYKCLIHIQIEIGNFF